MRRSTWQRRRRIALGVAAATLVLGVTTMLAVGAYCALTGTLPGDVLNDMQTVTWPHRFSPEAWRQHPHQRYQMALDLAQSGQLRGKSARWLQEMLGTPDVGRCSGSTGGCTWDVPSPRRPYDELVVILRGGAVIRWAVTSDPISIMD